jgi:hypothetical protein
VVWCKVLERETFELPAAEKDVLEMSWTDIQLLERLLRAGRPNE